MHPFQDKGHTKGGEHDPHWDHEAILGSKKEAEEFDELDPEEAKKRLRVLAVKMDRNGDGVVDKTEMHQWIVRSLRMLSKEESDEVGFEIWSYFAQHYVLQAEVINSVNQVKG